MAAKVTVILGPESGMALPMTRDEIVIGRGGDADMRLSSPEKRVSRRHARLFRKDGSWLVEDLTSQNGTLLDGRPLANGPQPLRFGAVIKVGEYSILFESASETPETLAAEPNKSTPRNGHSGEAANGEGSSQRGVPSIWPGTAPVLNPPTTPVVGSPVAAQPNTPTSAAAAPPPAVESLDALAPTVEFAAADIPQLALAVSAGSAAAEVSAFPAAPSKAAPSEAEPSKAEPSEAAVSSPIRRDPEPSRTARSVPPAPTSTQPTGTQPTGTGLSALSLLENAAEAAAAAARSATSALEENAKPAKPAPTAVAVPVAQPVAVAVPVAQPVAVAVPIAQPIPQPSVPPAASTGSGRNPVTIVAANSAAPAARIVPASPAQQPALSPPSKIPPPAPSTNPGSSGPRGIPSIATAGSGVLSAQLGSAGPRGAGSSAVNRELPVAPVATARELPVAPVATARELPVAPVATARELPVAPVATARELPVAPVASASDQPDAQPTLPTTTAGIARPERAGITRPRWKLLAEAFQRAATMAEPDQALTDVLRPLLRELSVRRAGLLLLDPKGRLVPGPTLRIAEEASDTLFHEIPARRALREQTVLWLEPPGRSDTGESRPAAVQHLWAPIAVGGRTFGVLQLDRAAGTAVRSSGSLTPNISPPSTSTPELEADLDFAAGVADAAGAVLESARSRRRLRLDNRELRLAAALGQPIIGRNPQLRKVLADTERVAVADTHLLIVGEPGTGKEQVAVLAHFRSRRAEGPLVRFDCVRRSAGLVECELFGYEDGTESGWSERRGKFELANGGTLFLDHVEDLSDTAQARLLKILDTRQLERIGSRSPPVPIDVRVIVSAEADLDAAVRAGRFRSDLLARLSAIVLRVPALRDRAEDVPELAHYYLRTFSEGIGRAPPHLSEELRRRLQHYEWPGNIRQLRNAMERLALLCMSEEITVKDCERYLPEAAVWENPTDADGMPIEPDDGEETPHKRAMPATPATGARAEPVPRPSVARVASGVGPAHGSAPANPAINGRPGGAGSAYPPARALPVAAPVDPSAGGPATDQDLKLRPDAETERRRILLALEQTRFSPSEAAKLLGIARGTLYRKMRDLNIRQPGRDG